MSILTISRDIGRGTGKRKRRKEEGKSRGAQGGSCFLKEKTKRERQKDPFLLVYTHI